MPKCSVVGCGSRKNENQKCLSLHRLPRSEFKKKKWLEAIVIENIKPNVKDIFICSLHFHESAFNKTLDVIRLREDAIPLLVCLPPQSHRPCISKDDPALSAENKFDTTPLAEMQNISNLLPVEYRKPMYEAKQPIPSTSGVLLPAEPRIPMYEAIQPVPSTSDVLEPKIKKLQRKCDSLTRKVRTLNEKVRRQKKKIANFKNIINELQQRNLVNNDKSIVLEACAGSKDFLKRQVLKSKGLPLERQYSEEIRKFASFFFTQSI